MSIFGVALNPSVPVPTVEAEVSLPLDAFIEKLEWYRPMNGSVVASYTNELCSYLAGILPTFVKDGKITPSQFLMEIEAAFIRLKNGRENDGSVITHHAADRVPTVEMFIRRDIPQILLVYRTEHFSTSRLSGRCLRL